VDADELGCPLQLGRGVIFLAGGHAHGDGLFVVVITDRADVLQQDVGDDAVYEAGRVLFAEDQRFRPRLHHLWQRLALPLLGALVLWLVVLLVAIPLVVILLVILGRGKPGQVARAAHELPGLELLLLAGAVEDDQRALGGFWLGRAEAAQA